MNKIVVPTVNPDWYNLGIQLLSKVKNGENKLRTIDGNNRNNSEKCCREMFEYWLKNAQDASWETLVEAVEIIDLIAFADKLKKVLLYI